MTYLRVNRNGRRWNPADLLDEGRDQDRLRIIRASVDRIVFEKNRAVGVAVETGTISETIRCEKQVIVCAGSIGSPCILMRSGIGPRDVLREHRIETRVELAAVGENLRDHLIVPVVFGLNPSERFPTTSTVREIAKWQTLGGGPLASNLAECGGRFMDNKLQIHVTPTHYLTHPSTRANAAMTMGVNATDPMSTGRVTLASSGAKDPPKIDPKYLTHPDDLQTTIEGVRLVRRLAKQIGLAGWVTGELLPGAKRDTDSSLTKSIARYSQTLYHPACTCAMGSGDRAVVDAKLSVRGTDNLSVVDASVFPKLTTGNPNAAVMTIADWFSRELLTT